MAFKLSKDQKSRLETHRMAYLDAVMDMNAKASEFAQFLDEIIEEKQGEFDEKSEKWQEGEKGEAAKEWIEAFEEVKGELEGLDVPEEFDLNDEA